MAKELDWEWLNRLLKQVGKVERPLEYRALILALIKKINDCKLTNTPAERPIEELYRHTSIIAPKEWKEKLEVARKDTILDEDLRLSFLLKKALERNCVYEEHITKRTSGVIYEDFKELEELKKEAPDRVIPVDASELEEYGCKRAPYKYLDKMLGKFRKYECCLVSLPFPDRVIGSWVDIRERKRVGWFYETKPNALRKCSLFGERIIISVGGRDISRTINVIKNSGDNENYKYCGSIERLVELKTQMQKDAWDYLYDVCLMVLKNQGFFMPIRAEGGY